MTATLASTTATAIKISAGQEDSHATTASRTRAPSEYKPELERHWSMDDKERTNERHETYTRMSYTHVHLYSVQTLIT